jgi:16S rRNA (guanine527-N7)-methyltransferase
VLRDVPAGMPGTQAASSCVRPNCKCLFLYGGRVSGSSQKKTDAELLSGLTERMGLVAPSAEQSDQLLAFCGLLLRWSAKINLVSVDSMTALVERHIADSFAAATLVVAGDAVIDVGSGGGLPALPLAILCPGITVELHEPRAKRLAFLRTAIRELGLKTRVSALGSRIEAGDSSAGELAGKASAFSVAMSRATWAPAEWLAIGRRLVGPAGRVLVFTTTEALDPLPTPDASVEYARNRRLCVFGWKSP